MSKQILYVDVLLPLNLWDQYTYVVPSSFEDQVFVGKRVIVQFGKSRLYAGLILKIHNIKPESFEPKEIEEVIDTDPILYQEQIQLWHWIARYYISPIGNVMAAALPSGFKLSSETILCFNDEINYTTLSLTDDEFIAAEALSIQREIAVSELKKILGKKNIFHIIKGLLLNKIAYQQEFLKDKYKVKFETVVRLSPIYADPLKKKELFGVLEKKSVGQLNVLLKYLQLAQQENWMAKSDLAIESEQKASVIDALIKKEIFESQRQPVSRLKEYNLLEDATFILSEVQQSALSQIQEVFKEKQTVLLHGITGSGKTEIYISLIKSYIEKGEKTLFLLPEIALTTQIVQRLEKYFGNDILVYHSKCNEAERVEIWQRVLKGEYKIVLGARSSIFLPFQKLGLVIVDEEHDGSYKQHDPDPRYHARDVVLYYATLFNSKVLLGSATPSTESYFNVIQNKYGYVHLTERFGESVLPDVEIIDMKLAEHQKTVRDSFSKVALDGLKFSLEQHKQSIVFQNRRGYAPYLECNQCAWIPMCSFCDVGMTYHKGINQLVCHYCNAKAKVPNVCKACKSSHLLIKGLGTEKVEDELKNLLPSATIERMDLDTTRGKDAHQQIIKRIANRETDILVGTQMLTKGLDFEHVDLVVVVNADNLIFMPDYKINERAFQSLCQVAGRAGRGRTKGKVMIQTSHPKHPIFYYLLQHDVLSFLKAELADRKKFEYPPFVRMIKISMKYKDDAKLEEWSKQFVQLLKNSLQATIIGPAKPIIGKIQNQYIREVMIKLKKDASFAENKEKLYQIMKTVPYEPMYRNLQFAMMVDI